MTRTYTFIIPGRPVGKESVRVAGAKIAKDGHAYVTRHFPKKTENFVATVKLFARQAGIPMMDRIVMDVDIVLPLKIKTLKTRPDEYFEPMVRPDRDNVNKSIGDALQGIVVADDKYILAGRTQYVFTKDRMPCTRVTITEADWRDYIEEGDGEPEPEEAEDESPTLFDPSKEVNV